MKDYVCKIIKVRHTSSRSLGSRCSFSRSSLIWRRERNTLWASWLICRSWLSLSVSDTTSLNQRDQTTIHHYTQYRHHTWTSTTQKQQWLQSSRRKSTFTISQVSQVTRLTGLYKRSLFSSSSSIKIKKQTLDTKHILADQLQLGYKRGKCKFWYFVKLSLEICVQI